MGAQRLTDTKPDWIAADWGTTHLRLWAMKGGRALGRRETDQGMGRLAPGQFGSVLEEAVKGWGNAEVVACGMVGSRQGWWEAPYRAVPAPARPALLRVEMHTERPIYIACGVSQSQPPDVMRGEETQIAGLLAHQPDFAGTICLPGTHTKWAEISNGRILHFRTFMTGELYDVICHHTVLRHSLDCSATDNAAFDAASERAFQAPAEVLGELFALRAGALLHNLPPDQAAAQLSGLLIGWEIALARHFWRSGQVALIASPSLQPIYQRALEARGVEVFAASAEDMTLSGLAAARRFRA